MAPSKTPLRCRSHISLPIRFSDTDAMGIVHHSRFFDYFEIARETYLRRRDVDFKAIFQAGHSIPLTGAGIRFDRPLRFGDVIIIEAGLAHLSRARLRFEYAIFHEAGASAETGLLASGWTEHVYTDMKLNLRRFPLGFIDQLLGAEVKQDG